MADFRIAIRALLRSRGFTATTVLTLALAIALNSAVLAVVSAYLLKSLPYPEAKRLYNIRYAAPDRRPPAGLTSLDWPSLADVIEHPIAWDLDMFYLVGGDHPEQAPGAWVTPGFMEGLGIRVARGRTFSPSDFQAGSPQVALISHSLWATRFGRDQRILGHRFHAYVSDRPDEAETFTIVGVLPQNFWHVNMYTEILAPLRAASYPYMARLREGIPPSVVEQRVTDLVKAGARAVPPDWRASVTPVHGDYVTRVKPILLAVAAAAGLVLLIACANVTFLLLIRATRREREVALRLALGSSRARLVRLLAAEGLVLAGAATAGGLAISALIIRSLAPVVERQLGRPAPGGASTIGIDASSVGIAIACCAVTAVIFGVAPLLMSWRADLARAMQARTPGGDDTKGRRRVRSALVAVEVAASLALVVGCALLVRTVIRMVSVDLGYRAERLIAGSIGLRERSYPDTSARLLFYDRLLGELAAIPEVDAIALANWPIVAPPPRQSIEIEQREGVIAVPSSVIGVGPGFFGAFGIARLHGREFTGTDRTGSEPIAVVSETLARRIQPDGRPLGMRIRIGARDSAATQTAQPWRTIVGVVSDIRQSHVDADLADL